jgi:O-antigen ligase
MRRNWALVSYLLLLFWIALGAFRSPIGLAQFGVDFLGLVNFAAIMFLAFTTLTTKQRFERYVDIVVAASTAVALLGVLQYVYRLGGYQEPGVNWIYRVGSIFGWANSLGCFLLLVIPVSIYRVVIARAEGRGIWITALAVQFVALGLTFSRAVTASEIVALIVTGLFLTPKVRNRILALLGAFALVVVLALFIPGLGLSHRILGDNPETLNARTQAWGALLQNLDLSNPFGHGWLASYALLGEDLPGGVGAPHNLYLQVLYDTGYVGLFLLLATLLLLIAGAWRRARRSHGAARIAAAVTLGGLVGVVVYLAFGNEILNLAIGPYFWLLAVWPYVPIIARQGMANRARRPEAVATAPAQTASTLPHAPDELDMNGRAANRSKGAVVQARRES